MRLSSHCYLKDFQWSWKFPSRCDVLQTSIWTDLHRDLLSSSTGFILQFWTGVGPQWLWAPVQDSECQLLLILAVRLSVLFLRQNKVVPGRWVGPSHEKRLLQTGKTIANALNWVSSMKWTPLLFTLNKAFIIYLSSSCIRIEWVHSKYTVYCIICSLLVTKLMMKNTFYFIYE